jgi:membrane protease YdiL (CAAX protease family)
MTRANAEGVMSRGILAFIGMAYGLSVALSLLIGLTGRHESALLPLSYLSMLLPAIAVLFVTWVMNEPPRIRWNSFPMRFLPAALFLIPGVLHSVMLPLTRRIEGGVQWQDWLTQGPDGLYHAPASRGWGALTIQGLVIRIVLNAVVGLIVVSFLALFEEVGWRAWLLPSGESDRCSPRCGEHLNCLGTLACTVPIIGNPARRWRVPASAFPCRRTGHHGGWLDPRLALAAHGKHLAGGHRSRCVEQLGTVCIQIHQGLRRTGHRYGSPSCRLFGSAVRRRSSTLARQVKTSELVRRGFQGHSSLLPTKV